MPKINILIETKHGKKQKIKINISSSVWLLKKSNYFDTLITIYIIQNNKYTTKIKIKIVMVKQAFIKK